MYNNINQIFMYNNISWCDNTKYINFLYLLKIYKHYRICESEQVEGLNIISFNCSTYINNISC